MNRKHKVIIMGMMLMAYALDVEGMQRGRGQAQMRTVRNTPELLVGFEQFVNGNPERVGAFIENEFNDRGYGQFYVHGNGQRDFVNIGQSLTVRNLYQGILKQLENVDDEQEYNFWRASAQALLNYVEQPATKSGHQWIKTAWDDVDKAARVGERNFRWEQPEPVVRQREEPVVQPERARIQGRTETMRAAVSQQHIKRDKPQQEGAVDRPVVAKEPVAMVKEPAIDEHEVQSVLQSGSLEEKQELFKRLTAQLAAKKDELFKISALATAQFRRRAVVKEQVDVLEAQVKKLKESMESM